MTDFQKNIIPNSSDYIEANTEILATKLSDTSQRKKNNFASFIKTGATVSLIVGTQFVHSNPNVIFKIPSKEIENSISNYHELVDHPTSKYITEINKLINNNFTQKSVIRELLSFQALINNWDGFGAIPLEIEASANAVSLINNLDDKTIATLSDISPQPNGTITFVWENVNEELLSLEIGNKTMSYYFSLLNTKTIYSNNIVINEMECRKIMELVSSL